MSWTSYIPGYDSAKTWLFGGDATKGMAGGPASGAYQTDYLKGMLGQGAPQMNQYQADQVRPQQQNLANMLGGIAGGTQAGAGEMAVNRQVGQAQAAQTAQASMARGANAALANRTAARNTADLGVAGAGQAGIAQMQDQQAAMGQLGSLLGGMRTADIGIAGANQQANMQQQQIQLSALAQMLGVDEVTLRQELAKRQLAAGDKGMFGSLLQQAGNIGAAYAGNTGK